MLTRRNTPGCHDNGYMPQLQSLLTSVYRDKLILLPGYSEMASDIGKLQLPSLVIPGLFIPEKIVIQTYSRMGSLQAPSGSTINNAHGELGPPPGLPSPPPTSLSAIKNDGSRTPESLDEEFPYKHDNNHESPVRRGSPSSTMSAPTGCPTPPPEGQQQRVALGKVSGGGPVSYRNIVQSAATIPAIGNDNNQRSQTKQNGNNTPVNVQPKQRRINPDIVRRLLPLHFYRLYNSCLHSPSARTIPHLAPCSTLPRTGVNTGLIVALVMIIFWTQMTMMHCSETPRRFRVLWQIEVRISFLTLQTLGVNYLHFRGSMPVRRRLLLRT